MHHLTVGPRVRNLFAAVLAVLFLMCACVSLASAAAKEVALEGDVYTFAPDAGYAFSAPEGNDAYTLGATPLGTMVVTGDAQQNDALAEGMPSFLVHDGQLGLMYQLDAAILTAAETAWHLVDDNSKKVNGEQLASSIMSGALIVQSSFDGENWYTDTVLTDVFETPGFLGEPFYTTKAIQLENGCYYRILLAYKMQVKVGEKTILIVDMAENESKKVVEVYRFFAKSQAALESDVATPDQTPRREFSTRVNTGFDNGYSQSNPLSKDDPHYGWELGSFVLNGYTSYDEESGSYLKNAGDRVTLWFVLDESCLDLTRLDNDPNLSICSDVNGYDQYFEVAQTNFGRGTLIIRYTDWEGVVHEPVVYTDFLAGNVHTGADTRVQLFEEGDYEVSLDYEIKHPGAVPMTWAYSNYKICFEFSIRNGNCMVFPLDVATASELSNGAITADGFVLDYARSRYLEINVEHAILKETETGVLTKDVRFSRPAKDGDSYTAPGIYTFTVKNKYTDVEETKVIYVGTDARLEMLSQNAWTLDDLNDFRTAETERIAAEAAAAAAAEEAAGMSTEEERLAAEEAAAADQVVSDKEPVDEDVQPSNTEAPSQPVEKGGAAGLLIVAGLVAVLGVAAGMVLMHRSKTPAGVVKRGKGSASEQAVYPDDAGSSRDGE